MIINIVLIQLS